MSLQKRGYDVFGFTDPLLALEHFHINKSTYSLVISDIRMPIMSGFEFVGKARIINPEVKILLMTAFDIYDQEFAGVTSKLKIDGFIQKPISMGKLNGIIDMHDAKINFIHRQSIDNQSSIVISQSYQSKSCSLW